MIRKSNSYLYQSKLFNTMLAFIELICLQNELETQPLLNSQKKGLA